MISAFSRGLPVTAYRNARASRFGEASDILTPEEQQRANDVLFRFFGIEATEDRDARLAAFNHKFGLDAPFDPDIAALARQEVERDNLLNQLYIALGEADISGGKASIALSTFLQIKGSTIDIALKTGLLLGEKPPLSSPA